MKNLEKYLLDAAGKQKKEISAENIYRDIAFDGENPRLGWVKPLNFEPIKKSIESITSLLEAKENFIFVGMGGSINGIKPLLAVFDRNNFFTLDNLDPKAVDNILSKIKSIEKTLVISISKSGTTQETQLLSKTLKNYFIEKLGPEKWQNNFLWLTDPGSFQKLADLGWGQVKKITIQADGNSDIGGRFSSPLTQIFMLPLFLLVGQSFDKLEKLYQQFIANQDQIRKSAYQAVLSLGEGYEFNFSPIVDREWGDSFASWVVQLFQESLGSKLPEKSAKTIVNFEDSGFIKLKTDFDNREPAASIMTQMHYYQFFIAFLSGKWNINFVSQGYVEKYKNKMRALEEAGNSAVNIVSGNLQRLISEVKKNIKPNHRFIEVVLYFCPDQKIVSEVQEEFTENFGQRTILNFVGSDWNHQSYQAAFGDTTTFYVLICLANYKITEFIGKDTAKLNVRTLRRVALATHQTLLSKSILYNFKNSF